MLKFFSTLIFVSSLFSLTPITNAAGGEMFIDVKNRGIAGDLYGAPITITIYEDGSIYAPKAGASVEFVVQNPDAGRECITDNNLSDSLGQIHARCWSDTAEIMHLMVNEVGADNSAPAIIYFDNHSGDDLFNPVSYKEEIIALKNRVEELKAQIEALVGTIDELKGWIGL